MQGCEVLQTQGRSMNRGPEAGPAWNVPGIGRQERSEGEQGTWARILRGLGGVSQKR